jgi:hypothetical protein
MIRHIRQSTDTCLSVVPKNSNFSVKALRTWNIYDCGLGKSIGALDKQQSFTDKTFTHILQAKMVKKGNNGFVQIAGTYLKNYLTSNLRKM